MAINYLEGHEDEDPNYPYDFSNYYPLFSNPPTRPATYLTRGGHTYSSSSRRPLCPPRVPATAPAPTVPARQFGETTPLAPARSARQFGETTYGSTGHTYNIFGNMDLDSLHNRQRSRTSPRAPGLELPKRRGSTFASVKDLELPWLEICLLGDTGVGKTCLVNQLMTQSFDKNTTPTGHQQLTYTFPPTLAASRIKGSTLRIHDIGGHMMCNESLKELMKKMNGAIICFDQQQRSSMQRIKEYQGWLTKCLDGRFVPVILCGCKGDLVATSATTSSEWGQPGDVAAGGQEPYRLVNFCHDSDAVSEDEVRQLSKQLQTPYILTSTLPTHVKGINDLFTQITNMIFDHKINRESRPIQTQRRKSTGSALQTSTSTEWDCTIS